MQFNSDLNEKGLRAKKSGRGKGGAPDVHGTDSSGGGGKGAALRRTRAGVHEGRMRGQVALVHVGLIGRCSARFNSNLGDVAFDDCLTIQFQKGNVRQSLFCSEHQRRRGKVCGGHAYVYCRLQLSTPPAVSRIYRILAQIL